MYKTSIAKQIQAAATVLGTSAGRMDRLRLLKLLYIADREAIQEGACTIIGGRMVALDNGPLHSDVYDLIKGAPHPGSDEWSQFFENDGYAVVMTSDPGNLELSPYESEKLVEVSERYKAVDSWALAEKTHEFPEWIEFHIPKSSQTISSESILKATGFKDDEIERIIAQKLI